MQNAVSHAEQIRYDMEMAHQSLKEHMPPVPPPVTAQLDGLMDQLASIQKLVAMVNEVIRGAPPPNTPDEAPKSPSPYLDGLLGRVSACQQRAVAITAELEQALKSL